MIMMIIICYATVNISAPLAGNLRYDAFHSIAVAQYSSHMLSIIKESHKHIFSSYISLDCEGIGRMGDAQSTLM